MPSRDPLPLWVVLGAPRPHSEGSLSISWDIPALVPPSGAARRAGSSICTGTCGRVFPAPEAEALHPCGHQPPAMPRSI